MFKNSPGEIKKDVSAWVGQTKYPHWSHADLSALCLTCLSQVFELRVGVCRITDRSFVRVRGELTVQFFGAVDEDGETFHLWTQKYSNYCKMNR